MLTYKQEVFRKFVHISSCTTIVIFLYHFGKDVLLPWILAASILFIILDYSRQYVPFIKHIAFTLFRVVTRPIEHQGLTGASWVFIGTSITMLLFNETAALIAILVLGLSDSASALIGIKYGATRLYNKSLEGSLAFLITTYLIIYLLSSSSFIFLLVGTTTATAIELFCTPKLNDNILIPVTTALILTLGGIH